MKKQNNLYYNNMTSNIQIILIIIIIIPIVISTIYLSSKYYPFIITLGDSIAVFLVLHILSLLLMNTSVVIYSDRIVVPLPPKMYIKKSVTFRVDEIDSIEYDGKRYDVRRKDGFHRSINKNVFPFNKPLEKAIINFCKENKIRLIHKTKK